MTPQRRGLRSNLLAGAAALALVILAVFVVAIFGDEDAVDGPAGSSFVTTPQGTAALSEVLEAAGSEVIRHRAPLATSALEGVDALVAADVSGGSYADSELDAVRSFVESGGTVVTAGRPNRALVSALVPDVPGWSPVTTLDGRRTIGGGMVATGRFGSFAPGAGIPLVVDGDRDLAIAYPVGSGRLVMFADVAMLSNAQLERATNAGFALAVIGQGRVMFDEFRHGYTDEGRTGLAAAAPDAWRHTALLAAVALVVALAVYGRRFGPAEPDGRDFVPGRDRLITAVASTLRRTGRPVEATAAVRAEVLGMIRRRALLPPEAGESEVRAAASMFLGPDEIESVFTPTADTVLAADRALARLSTIEGEPT